MTSESVIEQVRRVADTRRDADATVSDLQATLGDVMAIRAFCDSAEAHIVRRIASGSSFPEATIAEAMRESLGSASATLDRAETIDTSPSLSAALDSGTITSGHVDAVTRAGKGLDDAQRRTLLDKMPRLIDVAASATVPEFGRRLRTEVARILADDGIARLERQRRSTRLNTWIGNDGMWNLRGEFDPVTGLELAAKLETTVDALFAASTPDPCPADPIEKQKHLRALALSALVAGQGGGHTGRPEYVAVIDVAAGQPADRPGPGGSDTEPADGGVGTSTTARVSWPIPIEVPQRVLADMLDRSDVHAVVVCDGVVLHAPGRLDLGRSTRLASRAQRRALRGLYSSCSIPGCSTSYDRCRLHHVIWWRHGGRTDLDNLLPVCSHHHHQIHDGGWIVSLGTDRRLTLTLPDGTVRSTGPPRRAAA